MKDICFVITPVGDENSETRKKADHVINAINPILEDCGFTVIAPHFIKSPNNIMTDIIYNLLDSKLVVANLNELNPNVMYELAIRHLTGLPVVCIATKETKLPFDIGAFRTVFYEHDIDGLEKLKKEFQDTIDKIDYKKIYDNLAFRGLLDYIKEQNSKPSPFVDFFRNLHKKNKRYLVVDNGKYSRLLFDENVLTEDLIDELCKEIINVFSRYKIPTAPIADKKMRTITIYSGDDYEIMRELENTLKSKYGYLTIRYEVPTPIPLLKKFS